MTPATLVDGRALLEAVAASVVAGIGVTFVFSVAIWGAARFADLSRDERPLAAGAAALVACCSRPPASSLSGSSR